MGHVIITWNKIRSEQTWERGEEENLWMQGMLGRLQPGLPATCSPPWLKDGAGVGESITTVKAGRKAYTLLGFRGPLPKLKLMNINEGGRVSPVPHPLLNIRGWIPRGPYQWNEVFPSPKIYTRFKKRIDLINTDSFNRPLFCVPEHAQHSYLL